MIETIIFCDHRVKREVTSSFEGENARIGGKERSYSGVGKDA